MWLPLGDRQIVRYYRDIAEALPSVPLVVYDNPIPFKGKISTEVYTQLARIPEIVAAKHVGGPALAHDLRAVGSTLRLLPLEEDWCGFAEEHGDLVPACWSGVACAPAPIVALKEAIQGRDWDEAREISQQIKWALSTMFPGGDFGRFMNYSIQVGHARFRGAGLFDPGPCRPPYVDAPADVIAGGEETGRRWAELQRQYATRNIRRIA
jgi:4-(2-carboxyphenyl)-2-oxobut-3-enoate aldolase